MKDKIHQSTVWLIACLGFLLIIASLPAIVIAPLLRCIIFIKLIKKQVVITKKYFSIIAICWAIAWAGQEKTDNWFHNAREYTEKFIHQQQIRDAVGKQALFTRELFYPLLDTFMLGLPHTYRKIIADRGTAIRLKVQTDIGGEWTIIKTDTDWQLTETENISPVSTVSINPDTAWKLFSKGITPEEAGDTIEISGDKKMGETALQMVSVMA